METARRPVTNRRMAALESAAERVARTIADDHKIKVIVSGMMAAYEAKTKTLYLPAYSQQPDDPLLCAAHRGTLDHELAHVLFTDFGAAEAARDRWVAEWDASAAARVWFLWNVYEDYWIQPAYMRKYRGSKNHFDQSEAYVYEKTGWAKPCDPEYTMPGAKKPMGVFGALCQAIIRTAPKRVMVDIADVSPVIQHLMEQLKVEIAQGLAATNTLEALAAGEATWRKLQELAAAQPPPPPGEGEQEKGKGKPEEGEDEGTNNGDGETSDEADDGEGQDGGDTEEEGKASGGSAASKAAKDALEGEHTTISKSKVVAGADDTEEDAPSAGAGEEESEGGESGEEGSPRGGKESQEQTDEEHAPYAPGGAGGGGPMSVDVESAATAIGGEWGAVTPSNQVIGNDFMHEIPPQYTVHPQSAVRDRLVRYTELQRNEGRQKLALLEQTAGPAVKKLQSFLAGAFQASRQTLEIGGMEDGDEMDEAALPGIALGIGGRDVFTTTVRHVEESAFVTILVDCSGSMDSSTPRMTAKGPVICTKSGYAAVTSMAIHKALSSLRIPHGVLGYTTNAGHYAGSNPQQPNGYKLWSRSNRSLEMHEFVPAPGITDDGAALPFITGLQWNLDGESVLYAAKYAAQHGGSYDRVIMLVIADGLPAGADDTRIESAYLRDTVQKVAQAGIEVYGIGVCLDDFRKFQGFYPESKGGGGAAPTGSMEIKSEEGLTDTVLRELTRLLTRGYGMSRKGRK